MKWPFANSNVFLPTIQKLEWKRITLLLKLQSLSSFRRYNAEESSLLLLINLARSLKKYFSILLYIRLNIGIYPVLFHSHKSLSITVFVNKCNSDCLSLETQYMSAICPASIKKDMKYTLRVRPLKNELLIQFMTCQFPRFWFKIIFLLFNNVL